MLENQVYCVFDYETRSEADLPKIGAWEYARHPSTRLVCVSWRIGTFEDLRRQRADGSRPRAWSPALSPVYGEGGPDELIAALKSPGITLVAHNAFFEQVITRFVFSKLSSEIELTRIPLSRWLCTASQVRALALPGKLENACEALRLPVQKDMAGHRLMLKLSKPRKPRKAERLQKLKGDGEKRVYWHSKKEDLLRLMEYCATDVDAEVELLLATRPLIPFERELWKLDQKINARGFLCDRPLILKSLEMIERESRRFRKEISEITGGEIESLERRAAILDWLRRHGCDLPNLQKKTVEDALSASLASGKAEEVLRLRQAASKTSTAKYVAMEMRSRTDSRVRDNLVYHTASTGRWGGAGVQPQNFYRPTMTQREIGIALSVLEGSGTTDEKLETIRLLFGSPVEVFANLLRSMIRARKGRKLIGGDYAGIEVRVLFWLADHVDGLNAFREGRDLYVEMASIIYGRETTKQDARERQLGKGAILGCGFGMGKKKFFETCRSQGNPVEPELAERAVNAYRQTHHPVVRLWSNLERAAIAAVGNPGKKFKINRTAWWVEGKYLFCELPSGRRLAYYGPVVKQRLTPWGEKRPCLYHWGVDALSKKWVFGPTYGGKLTENVVQAVARDFMAEAMFRVEQAGFEIILTVHDEILTEAALDEAVFMFERIMAILPPWGEGCPIKVEAWEGERYRK